MSLKWPILVEWDVKPQLNQSTVTVMAYVVFECLKCLLALLMMLQYYEMSYGLNVEMHKQVSLFVYLLLRLFVSACLSSLKPLF